MFFLWFHNKSQKNRSELTILGSLGDFFLSLVKRLIKFNKKVNFFMIFV